MTAYDSQRVNHKVKKRLFLVWMSKILLRYAKINIPVERKFLKRSEDLKRHDVIREW